MNVCHICGIPWDADFFDESRILPAPDKGQEITLARYALHRNYCGVLMSFAQFTRPYASDPTNVETPGYQWQLRCNGRPRDPYLTFDRIINPWGSMPFPLNLRLEEGCVVEFVLRNVNVPADDPLYRNLEKVGGRIVGRYWYNNAFGGAPNRL
jgi:hypothetical protein